MILDIKDIEIQLNNTALDGNIKAQILEFLEKNQKNELKKLKKGKANICKKTLSTWSNQELWMDRSGAWYTDGNFAVFKEYCADNMPCKIVQKDFTDSAFCLNQKMEYDIMPYDFKIQKIDNKLTKLIYNCGNFNVTIDKKYYDAIIKPFIYAYDVVIKAYKKEGILHIYDTKNNKVIAVLMPMKED